MSAILHPLQKSIAVEVDYYDDEEKQKLLLYPSAKEIEEIVRTGVTIPTSEFLSYYLFHRKRLGTTGYRDYYTIGRKLDVALSMLDECINFNGHSICHPTEAQSQLAEVSEHVGEAVGLAVVNRIHGLTEADWYPIREMRGPKAAPTFDFEIASDGQHAIQVETKGSCLADNTILSGPIYQHKADIVRKKVKIAELEKADKYPFPAALRYGTIAAFDRVQGGCVKCWLLDPEPEEGPIEAEKLRLLNRMRFLRDWISFVSPRSQVASALATRVADLEMITNPFELEGIRLLRGNGQPFGFQVFRAGHHSTFMANKSRVTDGPAGGVVVQLSTAALLLLGFQENLLIIASEQSFDRVLSYKAEVDSAMKTVECTLSERRFRRLNLPPSIADTVRRKSGYVQFRVRGQIHYSQGGLVFGILPLPSN